MIERRETTLEALTWPSLFIIHTGLVSSTLLRGKNSLDLDLSRPPFLSQATSVSPSGHRRFYHQGITYIRVPITRSEPKKAQLLVGGRWMSRLESRDMFSSPCFVLVVRASIPVKRGRPLELELHLG